eukprot:6183242-Pleurochrysis_carterae.AAC.2
MKPARARSCSSSSSCADDSCVLISSCGGPRKRESAPSAALSIVSACPLRLHKASQRDVVEK